MGDWLEVRQGPAAGARLEIAAELTVGRLEAPPADLSGDAELSRRHARFWRAAGGQLLVEDLGSANGTFVNDERIDRPCLLTDGDRVSMGATSLVVREDKPTRVRTAAAQSAALGTPQPDLVPATGPSPPPPGPTAVSGAPARSPTRLVIVLSVLLALALVGLIVALLTRGATTTRPVLASAPVVSPIFP